MTIDLTKYKLPVVLAEYRSTKIEANKSYTDKTTGQVKQYSSIKHTFEFADSSLLVREGLGAQKIEDYKVPFTKGKFYPLELTSFAREGDFLTGSIASTAAPAPATSTPVVK